MANVESLLRKLAIETDISELSITNRNTSVPIVGNCLLDQIIYKKHKKVPVCLNNSSDSSTDDDVSDDEVNLKMCSDEKSFPEIDKDNPNEQESEENLVGMNVFSA